MLIPVKRALWHNKSTMLQLWILTPLDIDTHCILQIEVAFHESQTVDEFFEMVVALLL